MTQTNAIRSALFAILLLPGLAPAELVQLDTDITPDRHVIHPGDTLSVTASGDAGLPHDYRFLVQRQAGRSANWVTVVEQPWSATNTFSVDMNGGTLFLEGNYRLVSMVREPTMPDDYLASYRHFTFDSADVPACDYLDGKEFVNRFANGQQLLLGALTLSSTLSLFGLPGVPFYLGNHAGGVTSVQFDATSASGGIVTLKPVSDAATGNMNRVTGTVQACTFLCINTPLDTQVDFTDAPVTGTYTCNGNTATLDASGAGDTGGFSGLLSVLGSSVYMHFTGDMSIDPDMGTVSAGGAVFRTAIQPRR